MLKCKDIILYIKDLFTMNSVYDCVRPFLLVSGIFGVGGSKICETEGVRSVRNTRFSLVITVLLTLLFMPYYFINFVILLFDGKSRPLWVKTCMIIFFGINGCVLFTITMGCILTHVYCKNLTKVLQILNNTDMMLQQENIKINYWKILLKTILFGLISLNYIEMCLAALSISSQTLFIVGKLFVDFVSDQFLIWIILFLLIIRENYVGLNKLLLQNGQVSDMQDNSLLTIRRISMARDIHEQLSEGVVIFSDISRFVISGLLVASVLNTLRYSIVIIKYWIEAPSWKWERAFIFLHPIIRILILIGICETHKNNRRVLTARLRRLIAFAEDRRIVHQLKQYILFNHTTIAGLVDFQLIDIDFTLLFTVIDIIASYAFVIYSTFRT